MHSSTLILALLPLLAMSAPTLSERQMPGCRPQMPCYTGAPSPAPNPSPAPSGPPPGQPQIVTGNNSPEQAWRKQNEAQQSCTKPDDCKSYCAAQMASDADAQEYGVSQTCLQWAPLGSKTLGGICMCGSGKNVAELAAGFGDMVCIAANMGINGGIGLGLSLIPYVGPEAKVIEGVYNFGKKVVKKGVKDCGIDFCPDHQYTVVDSSNFSALQDVMCSI